MASGSRKRKENVCMRIKIKMMKICYFLIPALSCTFYCYVLQTLIKMMMLLYIYPWFSGVSFHMRPSKIVKIFGFGYHLTAKNSYT